VVVIEGSVLCLTDLRALLDRHRRSGAVVSIAVSQQQPASDNGTGSVPAGIYVFAPRAIEYIKPYGYEDIKEKLLRRLYEAGEKVILQPIDGPTWRITGPESYLEVSGRALEMLTTGQMRPERYISRDGQVWVHPSSQVAETACIIGPVMIGPRCVIDAEAVLVGPTCIGADCRIGQAAVVSRSVLWNEVHVCSASEVDQAVLTHGVQVPERAVVRRAVCIDRPLDVAETLVLRRMKYDVVSWPRPTQARTA